jgi:hypothetical protein
MRPQHIMMVLGIFIIGTLLCCLGSGRWLLNGETNVINTLASFQYTSISDWSSVRGPILWWNALVTACSWDYPFLSSPWAIFVKIPLWIFTLGTIWAVIEVFIQVGAQVVSGIRSLLGTGA